MKATDLTVGCYVMVHPSNMVIKVAAVYRSQVGYMADGKIVWVLENLLRPIPLNKVHLVKNGFEPVDEDDDCFIFKDGYELEVSFDNGYPNYGVEPSIGLSIDFAEKEMYMAVKYLHTLQQALKLFEVDKEIVI